MIAPLDLTHLLDVELQLRGWVLTVDLESEIASLYGARCGFFHLDDERTANEIARRETQAHDQVLHWVAVQHWVLRRRNLQTRAVHPVYGSTHYTARWSELEQNMLELVDGSRKPFYSRAAADVAARRAQKVSRA